MDRYSCVITSKSPIGELYIVKEEESYAYTEDIFSATKFKFEEDAVLFASEHSIVVENIFEIIQTITFLKTQHNE